MQVFLSAGGYDHATADLRAGISRRLGGEVIRICVNDDGFSNHITETKA